MMYLDIETNEKVEALPWNGETLIFQEWERKHGKLPFVYSNFPELRIQNSNSNIYGVYSIKIGDWVVRTRMNEYIGFKDSIFKVRYKEI